MKKNVELEDTGFKDKYQNLIKEGDILAGLTDQLTCGQHGLFERDFVRRHVHYKNPSFDKRLTEGWYWNGHKLDSVVKNVKKIGDIFTTPELLLIK